ncbi:hypothetical protein Lfu02_47780 [Longispora fulva]|nr:hypothetical protein Lfu02_47780 [Longispora fulva]
MRRRDDTAIGNSKKLQQRTGVQDTGRPQRPTEGPAPLCQRETGRNGMQTRTSARQPAAGIRGDCAPHNDHSQ